MSNYAANIKNFKQLVATLDPDHPNVRVLQTITENWREFSSTHISVESTIKGSKLIIVFALVLDENLSIWRNDFPKWISTFIDCVVDYSGIPNICPDHEFASLVRVLKKYIVNEVWDAIYILRRAAAFFPVKNILLQENEVYDILKTKALSNNNTLTLLHNVTFGHDEWQLKVLQDKPLLFDLLKLTSSDPDAWMVFYNVAKHPDAKTLLPPEVLKKATQSSFIYCTDICVLLCNDENMHLVDLSTEWIEKTIKILTALLNEGRAKYKGINYNLLDLVLPLANLSVVDTLKESLGKQFIPLLLRVVTEKLPDVGLISRVLTRCKQEAARALWNFAYVASNRNIISSDEGIAKLEDALKEVKEDDILQRNIEGILYMFNPPPSAESTSEGSKGHIMISYNWGNQGIVKRIANSLKEKGYQIWIDVEQMQGSTLEATMTSAVASAIENADLVLMCLSQKYKDSPNCRLEGEYCIKRKTEIIPLMMQHGYKPDGWLGISVGSKLWIDFSDERDWESKVDALIKAIGSKGKMKSPIISSANNSNSIKEASRLAAISNISDISEWLEENDLRPLIPIFIRHHMNGPALTELKRLHSLHPKFLFQTCSLLGLTDVGDILKLSAAIHKLN